jgi:hypothetical protein
MAGRTSRLVYRNEVMALAYRPLKHIEQLNTNVGRQTYQSNRSRRPDRLDTQENDRLDAQVLRIHLRLPPREAE